MSDLLTEYQMICDNPKKRKKFLENYYNDLRKNNLMPDKDEINKDRILDNLQSMKNNLKCDTCLFKFVPKNYLDWLEQAINYIKNH